MAFYKHILCAILTVLFLGGSIWFTHTMPQKVRAIDVLVRSSASSDKGQISHFEFRLDPRAVEEKGRTTGTRVYQGLNGGSLLRFWRDFATEGVTGRQIAIRYFDEEKSRWKAIFSLETPTFNLFATPTCRHESSA